MKSGLILITLGALGCLAIILYDPLMGKPVNDFTGPVSTPALVFCAVVILAGIIISAKAKAKKK
jgi:hypothetical protein